MKNRLVHLGILLSLTSISTLSAPLEASLVSAFQTAFPGETVTFEASLLNDSAGAEFLNGIGFSLAGPLVVDDTPFFLLTPPSLPPGDSHVGPIFMVTAPFTTPLGVYTGAVDIIGGATSDSQELLARMEFGVLVTPEPSTLVLIAPVLIGFGVARRKLTI